MVKVRIAPSPTGDPHVGTAYSALFNWIFARRNNGGFILRIEDTDRTRSTPASERAILESLRWLGLDWDEGPDKGGPNGPYRQSERSEIYRTHVEELIRKGRAYPCFCTAERLAALREAGSKGKQQFLGYDGFCRELPADDVTRKLEAGERHVVRLKVDKQSTTVFQDEVRGEVSIDNVNVDDQVLLKSDGFPTYHLANVVDDHLMGITHVIRAEEWISSTPKHVMLYDAFGWECPRFIHLPLLRNKDKSKISKRKNPTSILYYKEKGFLPEALLNFLALMGGGPADGDEIFSRERMVAEIDPARIRLGGPVFDLEKLEWLNGVYIRSLAKEELADRVMDGFTGELNVDRETLIEVIELIQVRMKTLSEFGERADFFFSEPVFEEQSFKKVKLPPADVVLLLERALPVIESIGLEREEELETRLRDLAAECEVKVGQMFMALRVALTGKTATPPLIESMAVLGLRRCLDRLQAAVDWLQ